MYSVYIDNDLKYYKLNYNELIDNLIDIFWDDIKYCICTFDGIYKALSSSKLSVQVYKFDKFKNIEFEVQSLFADISNLLYDKYCKKYVDCRCDR